MEFGGFSVRRGEMTYFYLDSPGIWALYDQTINDVENEFDRLYRTDPTGSLEEKTALARRLSDLLGSGPMTSQAASGRSKRLVDEIKAKLSVEEKVARLIDYQQDLVAAGSLRRMEIAVRKWRYGATYYRPDFFDVETIYTVMRAYSPSEYSGKVIFFKGEYSVLPYGFHESSEIEWKRLVGQGLEIEQLSCDHATIMKGPYVAQVAHIIRAAMDRAINRDRQAKEKVRARAGHSADAVISE